ncbi:MAG: MFS transporter [Acidobacteria bacterium]|jgi:predicted MFS family arabinose efflux permease|nr:MAG: MFS transporter [Acidobacteriota bacterium]PYT57233.1 MAG: MFS transporter [Acidobacteriota bacterium]
MLAAFGYRDFRVQWIGACSSAIGTWMQIIAQNWLVLSLTNSPFFLGLDAFLQQLPIIMFTLIGGVFADRYDRRKTLLASQYIQMFTSGTLAVLMYMQVVQVWHIMSLSFITGVAQSFGGPAYQSLLPSLVAEKDLPNAIALNSIQFNLAQVLGPLLFAATLATFLKWGYNEPQAMNAAFFLNALSFLIVIGTLMSLHVKHVPPTHTRRMREELQGGLHYVRNHGSLVALIVLAAATTFLGFAVLTFLPVFTQRVFRGGAGTYSHLMAFSGTGSIAGALVVAWLGKFKRMGVTALTMQAIYGLLILAFSMSHTIWLSEVLLLFTGASLMMVFSTITSLVQLIAPNAMRGRVMSIYMVAFRGGMPLGSLAGGYFATIIGAPKVIGINGSLLVLVALYLLFVRSHGIRESG